jgi:hypothetical protein
MGGHTVNPAFTTLMAKRFHVLYLHILHRLWLRGESDEPYEAHSATDAVRKEKRAEAAE